MEGAGMIPVEPPVPAVPIGGREQQQRPGQSGFPQNPGSMTVQAVPTMGGPAPVQQTPGRSGVRVQFSRQS